MTDIEKLKKELIEQNNQNFLVTFIMFHRYCLHIIQIK